MSVFLHRVGLLKPAEAGLATVSFQDHATSTSASVTAPSSIDAGDLLILSDITTVISGTPTTVVPSGFTSIVNTTGGVGRAILSYKIADGSESSSSITGMDGDDKDSKILLQFRGDVPIVSATPADPDGEATSGNPTSQTVTASGGTPPLIVFGAYWAYSVAVSPRTMSPAKDDERTNGTTHYLAWKIYNESPADVSVDMDDESDLNILQSCYIQLA